MALTTVNGYETAALYETITIKEASDMWERADKTLIQALMAEEKRTQKELFRKSGGTWLTTMGAVRSIYGEPSAPRPHYE